MMGAGLPAGEAGLGSLPDAARHRRIGHSLDLIAFMPMSVSLDARLKVSGDLLYQRVRDESVILDLAGEQYYSLNAVGSRIWDLLTEDHTLAQIAEIIAQEFDVPLLQVQDDLLALVEQLATTGLAVVESSWPASSS